MYNKVRDPLIDVFQPGRLSVLLYIGDYPSMMQAISMQIFFEALDTPPRLDAFPTTYSRSLFDRGAGKHFASST
jgi:hypothetical protein